MKDRKEETLLYLKRQMKINKHIIGVATGSGLTAKYAEKGGADFILALSSGRFRQMGVSSLAAFLPFTNSNDLVMNYALKEIIPSAKVPVLFGLSATDPTINLQLYIKLIKEKGFSGINNYPTIGLIDGGFREALEEQGISYEQEVTAIRIASSLGLFTVAFVFNEQQAIQMIEAGADIICVHLGLTVGGVLGAKQIQSLQSSKRKAANIFEVCNEINPHVIKMIYGGPVNKPIDVQFMYDGIDANGYIGGSVFERIPAEQMIPYITQSFKQANDVKYEELIQKFIDGISTQDDYIDFMKKYIGLHYSEPITLNELAGIMNLSRSYLSTLFKKEMGISFTTYLIDYRINRAIEILHEKSLPLNMVAELVGYSNYAQFSKIFKSRKGVSPSEYIKTNKKTK